MMIMLFINWVITIRDHNKRSTEWNILQRKGQHEQELFLSFQFSWRRVFAVREDQWKDKVVEECELFGRKEDLPYIYWLEREMRWMVIS